MVLEQFGGDEILILRIQIKGILPPFMASGDSPCCSGNSCIAEVDEINAKAYDDGKTHNHIPGKPFDPQEDPKKVMAEGKGYNGGSKGQKVVHGDMLLK